MRVFRKGHLQGFQVHHPLQLQVFLFFLLRCLWIKIQKSIKEAEEDRKLLSAMKN